MTPSGAAPASTYVAVAEGGAASERDDDLRLHPCALDERLAPAAVRAATADNIPLLAALGLAAVACSVLLWVAGGWRLAWWPVGACLAGIGLLLTSPAARARNIGLRPSQRWLIALGLAWGWLAVVPWLVAVRSTADGELAPWAAMLALAAAGLMAAVTLAPLPRVSAFAAALPLAGAVGMAFASASSWPMRGLWMLAGAGLAMAAWGAARSRWAAWRQTERALIERDEKLHRFEAERDAAWQSNRDKSRFLAIASHDLRQPVHALGLFAATLDKRLQGSAEAPLVRNVMRAIDGLDRSFNALLDVSRLDAGTIEPNRQQFPLRDLFRRLHMHFAGQAELAGLALRFSPGGKSVTSDPQLLERVLGNLVQNAMKYTEHGGVVVVARSTSTHINIEVWDTGIGIAARDLPRIFDEFYQVGRSDRDRARGLGMGLAIVKRLVHLLGHSLTVRSLPGQGTMFRIGIALGGLPGIEDVTGGADTVPMPIVQPRMLLIVDDEEPIREGLRLLLEEWGYQAVTAGSVDEVEAAVASVEARVDLVLSDLHLGDGPDGLEAIALVHRLCGAHVPALLITGDTSPEELQRMTDSGHLVLFKPVQPGRLYNALRSLFS